MESNKKIAIYPGSFNPFTIGHLNILEKSEAIFGSENVIIAIGVNPEKIKGLPSEVLLNMDPRVQNIKNNLPSKNVEIFTGFLTDYIWEKEKEGFNVTIIKGLRNGDDLDYEVNQLRFMEEMKPDIKVIFITCDKQFEHVSSSAYRALEAIRPGAGHRYIAKEIPNVKMVSTSQCVVISKKDEEDILEKYTILAKHKAADIKGDFSGTYVECLEWIKNQEMA